MRPHLAIIAFGAALLAGPAFAATPDDEVIATAQAKPSAEALAAQAPPAPAATAATPPLTTQQQIDSFIYSSPPMDQDHRGLLPADRLDDRDADGKRKIHGSMGVSVGTGGYRSAYASALIPVGENTTVGVAVSQTDFGKRGGYYADPYYGGGYYGGYGYGYGPGYGRTRGGSQQSVALSVMAGAGGRGDSTPEGCAPGFRDGGRYVEPLWVEGLRDGAHPCSAAAGH
ncbi:hypothetical protein [Caulobacter sp. RL271]|jgi:hypothetical protein|uniref:Uncharacterized protein n=1 Tax=Caulobacter segnis TaxID=88688 RepID=A0ABY4ZXT4_9CAUL|nr:hypothetical protein [Caulobacter segnis]USQ96726.1 hypothetical protein MZV50_03855 [Caulobacter segnis]